MPLRELNIDGETYYKFVQTPVQWYHILDPGNGALCHSCVCGKKAWLP